MYGIVITYLEGRCWGSW